MLTIPDRISSIMLHDPVRVTARLEWSPDWSTWLPLRIISGTHVQSRTVQTRWTFTAKVAKDYPVNAEHGALHSYGPRARLFLGVTTLRTGTYWIPAGVYSITAADESDDNVSIDLTGASFETEVIDSQFVQARNVPDHGGWSIRRQAETLITEAVPDAAFVWDPRVDARDLMPKAIVDNGRWDFIDGTDRSASICGAIGADAGCDATGTFVFTPTPTMSGAPTWSVARGGVLATVLRGYDRDNVKNLVAASGQAADGTTAGPVYAWDADQRSITYAGPDPIHRLGQGAARFGVKPVVYTNSLITTAKQAGLAAHAQLAQYIGVHYEVSFTARFNPAAEVGDVIQIESRKGVMERHLLDSISYDWTSMVASCVTRSPKEDIQT